MYAEPRIETIPAKKVIGIRNKFTLSNNHMETSKLWRQLMPRRNEINSRVNLDHLSIQFFDEILEFEDFNPTTELEKWAAVEVFGFDNVPEGMETFTMVGGKYAVFIHKGTPGTFPKTLEFIFTNWLPRSGYKLDHRAHFEILKEDYSPTDPTAEEEVWIPIK